MTNPIFGQVVIGPPGSGKTTYCHGMQQLLRQLGRKVAVVNVDPGNDELPYDCAIDVAKLITQDDVMDYSALGPNASLMYCMEYLEANSQWLVDELGKLGGDHYVIFDFPGQVELYTHHGSVRGIIDNLTKRDFRLCGVHLVDSHCCSDPGNFVAVLLTSLNTMMQVELPFVNILSKVDLMEKNASLHFNMEFYTDVLDIRYLLKQVSVDPFLKKYKKLNMALAGVIERYGLVSYQTLHIENKESLGEIVKSVDRANGYIYGIGESRTINRFLSSIDD